MGTTARLAEWAVGVRYGDIPSEAVSAAKRALLDNIGCALVAADERVAIALVNVGQPDDGDGDCSIIGFSTRATPQAAALLNGTLAHALDYDDTHESVRGHPTAPIMPAALALGEVEQASGRELIAAYVVALEVIGRIGQVVNMAHYDRGWHSSSTLGAIGAAVAGARMLRLDSQQLRHALGMACSLASGLQRNFGTDTKPLQVGAASRSGVLAALLAAQGVDADPNILDGRRSFCSVAGQPDAVFDESSLGDLGQSWQILEPGLSFKRYPSCYSTHRPINAVLALLERHSLPLEQVEKIECVASYTAVEKLIYPRPTTALEAKFSMQFCLAAALIDGRLGLSHFSDRQVNRPDIQALIPKVSVTVHPEQVRAEQLRDEFAEVTVQLSDGSRFGERIGLPIGHAKRPLSDSDLDAKFLDCAATRLGHTGAEHSLHVLRSLESVKSVGYLMSNLVPLVAVGS